MSPQADRQIEQEMMSNYHPDARRAKPVPFYRNLQAICVLAALLALLIIPLFLNRSTSDAGALYAAMQEQLRNDSATVRFTITERVGDAPPNIYHVWIVAPAWHRIDESTDRTTIVNSNEGLVVTWDHADRKAYFSESRLLATESTRSTMLEQVEGFQQLRQQLVELVEQPQQYLGQSSLEGRKVAGFEVVLENEPVTIWVDAQTAELVQLEKYWTSELDDTERSAILTGLSFDPDLPDDLFDMQPPPGYEVIEQAQPLLEPHMTLTHVAKATLMRSLLRSCHAHLDQHGHWPEDLQTAIEHCNDCEMLNELSDPLAELDLVYLPPETPDQFNPGSVLMYERFTHWPEQGINVGFCDGHVELVGDQQRFEQLLVQQ